MSELLAAVREQLRPSAAAVRVERVTVGEAAVLVELRGEETTMAGLAHLPTGGHPDTKNRSIDSLLAGATTEIGDADQAGADGTATALSERALGIAAMNALSAPLVDWQPGDPMAHLAADVQRITTVGLFTPAFRKFDDVEVCVIEREPIDDLPDRDGVRVRAFTPAEAEEAMQGAEVVFVTGSAFIYGGVEAYLDAAPASATVVVIGATASFLPNPLFAAGVDVVAGATVADVAGVRAALRAGACGTDLHDAGLTKVYVATDTPSGIRLDAATTDRGPGIRDETEGSTTDNI